jgi:16S rRNA G1207 methylase RsmC
MGGKYPGKTVVSDGLDHPYFASKQYDLVMLNPPFSVGKATCHKLITQ